MKHLIFDAGAIISLTMNGLLPIIEKLKKEFNGEFIITPQIKREIVDKPMNIKKYQLEAVKVQNLIDKGVLTLSSKIISNQKLQRETNNLLKTANSIFSAQHEKINLIHEGEASCLAFANLCNCDNAIVIDERTTRMITEAPEKLQKLMQEKLHTSFKVDKEKLKPFQNFKFIRSSELLYIAYKKKLFDLNHNKTLISALLYAVKFTGTSISSREINEMKQLA